MQSNKCYVIKPIKNKVLFCVIIMLASILVSFIIFAIFGNVWGRDFDALNNEYTYLETGVKMTEEQIKRTSLIVVFQRILVFIFPALICFALWKIFQRNNNCFCGFKLGVRAFLYIETIVLFGYSLFSAIHYLTAMEYWGIGNPYQNSEIIIFLASIILSGILNKSIIGSNDEEIEASMFKNSKSI